MATRRLIVVFESMIETIETSSETPYTQAPTSLVTSRSSGGEGAHSLTATRGTTKQRRPSGNPLKVQRL